MKLPSHDSSEVGALAVMPERVHPHSDAPVIVVGGGPAGLRVAQDLARRDIAVIQFNAERWKPYNRLKLTPFLAGEVQIGIVYQPNLFPPKARVTQYTGQTVVAIDRDAKTVTNNLGRSFAYSKLVLCLGSHAHIPPIPGRDLVGVYRFRNFDDVELLVARSLRSRRTVVIGGGLLGLEAARGMALRRVETVVVEHESHLMARQLDKAGGTLLEKQIVGMGIGVRTGNSVKAIEGAGRVERVVLANGEAIDCDTVIICTGIRPNIELARNAGIVVGRGITVDDAMRTSDPAIYAAGECAEHDGNIYGLVAPGLEQAAVAAACVAGGKASYRGSVPTTKLKIVGTDVFSMGDIEQIDQRLDLSSVVWQAADGKAYRRLIFRRGRLVGAMAVGDWPEVNRIQQAVRDHAFVWPWQFYRFRSSGILYPVIAPKSAAQWPAAATVCNCTGVTRGQLGEAMRLGATTVEGLMQETNASTVCGTCRPLLLEILGEQKQYEPVFGARTIGVVSVLAVLAALVAWFAPPWPYSRSMQQGLGIDRFWLDGDWKQVTGFTLLGLSGIIAFLSVRKRLKARWLGHYKFWRIVHAVIGTAALGVLFMHTGFRLGNNLNFWLMATFLAVAVIGSITGVITAQEHKLLSNGRASPRAALVWLHILTFWPMPVLLMLHVVTVYAY
ncbi:FAD-dependent oxidoreductase [Pseudolabrys sp. FHR47]|uniref:FAD-dependent oxidoreductase n=1 Tax=Pseudolabrys sp. FHR47 TaxID=2562284 RepID=UPI0010BF2C77|nr:FAD-dependent oxidoreductase [Pseudolabrys sp. FHR47]